MKRFLLFVFSDYYPSGGWLDMKAMGDSVEDLKNRLFSKSVPHSVFTGRWHIVDTLGGCIVSKGNIELGIAGESKQEVTKEPEEDLHI